MLLTQDPCLKPQANERKKIPVFHLSRAASFRSAPAKYLTSIDTSITLCNGTPIRLLQALAISASSPLRPGLAVAGQGTRSDNVLSQYHKQHIMFLRVVSHTNPLNVK